MGLNRARWPSRLARAYVPDTWWTGVHHVPGLYTLKREPMHHQRFASLDEARGKVFGCIEVSCCRQRLHSVLDGRSRAGFVKIVAVP